MAARAPMRVTFCKHGRCCAWTAHRPPRTQVRGPVMAAGADVPHDLATFVIEAALGIGAGFWGCVAAGATFRTLDRRRTPQGIAVIAAHRAELDDAERRVNEAFFAWRGGRPTDAGSALDEMLVRWRALPDGGALTCEWPPIVRGVRTSTRPSDTGHRGRAAASRPPSRRPVH